MIPGEVEAGVGVAVGIGVGVGVGAGVGVGVDPGSGVGVGVGMGVGVGVGPGVAVGAGKGVTVGDTWQDRPSARSGDGNAHPDMQITLMNSRVAALIAQDKDRWQLSGDQLFADLDLSAENVPPGTRIAVGSAILEATDQPHTGCKKFSARFGVDALKLVSSPIGEELQLRGINLKVVQSGEIKPGDAVKKL